MLSQTSDSMLVIDFPIILFISLSLSLSFPQQLQHLSFGSELLVKKPGEGGPVGEGGGEGLAQTEQGMKEMAGDDGFVITMEGGREL